MATAAEHGMSEPTRSSIQAQREKAGVPSDLPPKHRTPVTAAALAALPDNLEGGPALRANLSRRASVSEASDTGSARSVVDAVRFDAYAA